MHAVDPDVAPAQHRQRAERDLDGDERDEQRGRPRQFASVAGARPDVTRRRDDRQRDDERADAVREVDRDLRRPSDPGSDAAEHQREIRNRQAGAVCRIVAPTRICT